MWLLIIFIVPRLVVCLSPQPSFGEGEGADLFPKDCNDLSGVQLGHQTHFSTIGLVRTQLLRGIPWRHAIVKVNGFKILCATPSTRFIQKKTSLSVLVNYDCQGSACQNPADDRPFRLLHVFYLHCGQNSVWDIYRHGNLGEVFRDHGYASLDDAPTYSDSNSPLCSICLNVQNVRHSINAPVSTAHQCIVCDHCGTDTFYPVGNGLCLPSYADTEMSCCRYFDENDTCVFDCPGAPTYELFEEPPRMYCWKKINIYKVGGSSPQFCVGNGTARFDCEVVKSGVIEDAIFWSITFPGREPITVTGGSSNAELGLSVSVLAPSMERYRLQLAINAVTNISVGYAEVHCSYTGYLGELALADVSRIAYYVPNKARNFRITRRERLLTRTEITLEWDPPVVPSFVFQYNSLSFSIFPEPLSGFAYSDSSPASFSLANGAVYNASVSATNCAGTNSSVLTISTNAPAIRHADAFENTESDFLSLEVQHGDAALTFICRVPNIEGISEFAWERNGFASLPHQVTQVVASTTRTLQWNRPLEAWDTADYWCRITSAGADTLARLQLAVKHPGTVISFVPNYPSVIVSSSEKVKVHLGHVGHLLTCVAFGSPTPVIVWTVNGQDVTVKGIYSSIFHRHSSLHVTSALEINGPFTSEYAGNYSCKVRSGRNSVSSSVLLEATDVTLSPVTPFTQCSLESFRIRVVDANCQSQLSSLKTGIGRIFTQLMTGVIAAECPDCVFTSEHVALSSVQCDALLPSAVIILGRLTIGSFSEFERISCVIMNWHQKGSLLQLKNGTFYPVDVSCPLIVSTHTSECSGGSSAVAAAASLPLPLGMFIPTSICAFLVIVIALSSAVFILMSLRVRKGERAITRIIRKKIQRQAKPKRVIEPTVTGSGSGSTYNSSEDSYSL